MKSKFFIAGGLALCASSSFAQSSITLYGILDTGVEYISHAGIGNNRLVRMPGITGELPSRWGIRGSEDLGGGMKAVFTLENGFNVRDGSVNQGGRFFGRQAFVGLDTPYGVLTFGRQYTMSFWALIDSAVTAVNIYGVPSFDNYLANVRSDNTISYRATFKGLMVGATYSLGGRDAAGTGNSPGSGTCAGTGGANVACRQWSGILKYDAPLFGGSVAYDEQRGGTGASASFFNGSAPLPLSQSGDKDARVYANGYIKVLDNAKLSFGWIGRRVDTVLATLSNVHSNIFYVGAAYTFTPAFTLDGQFVRTVDSTQDTRGSMGVVRGTYSLSKRTAVYAQAAYLMNSANARYTVSVGGPGATPNAGVNQLAAMLGIRTLF